MINAALDDRDIVCVMPTGGGKSLTYQLPAVMGAKGLTVVISPLLALIWDQVRALREIGVECVMLTGGTGKEEQNEIYKRMEEGGKRGNEIRLCYVTVSVSCLYDSRNKLSFNLHQVLSCCAAHASRLLFGSDWECQCLTMTSLRKSPNPSGLCPF